MNYSPGSVTRFKLNPEFSATVKAVDQCLNVLKRLNTVPFLILLNFDDGLQMNTALFKFVPLVRHSVALKNINGEKRC
ncbi:hypothetical protein KAH55_03400 [bacterium]|nr:hypothetical protein [bacterium]